MNIKLFSPITFRNIDLKNRAVVSPMCQYSSNDGVPNDWHLVHLGSRAVGGAGLIIAEATSVSPEGRISPFDLGIWNNEQADAFKKITAFITEQGSVPGIQIAHAGRKASTNAPWLSGNPMKPAEGGWIPSAPSALPFADNYSVPKELSQSEIEILIEKFRTAAVNAVHAGFKIIEIHMAHGYLMHEFLSPLANKRNDEFGGTIENRMKVPLKIADTVRKNVPDELPVFVRLSVSDWAEGGWDANEAVIFCRELKKIGIDLIDCSSGGLVPDAKIKLGFGYQVHFSSLIKNEVKIATGSVGMIISPEQAEQILINDDADLIIIGREMLREPYWALNAAKKLGADVKWPIQYERAKR